MFGECCQNEVISVLLLICFSAELGIEAGQGYKVKIKLNLWSEGMETF